MNTLGINLRLTTFGESHGPAMGGVLDGMPPGVKINLNEIQAMIDRRRTGRSQLTSQRKETDIPEILSGINPDGLTLGSPIGFIFRNTDARSGDYSELETHFRPNHADYAYYKKYGIRDPRGGGRASARETVNWVMGGALAMQWLKTIGVNIEAKLTSAGTSGYPDPVASLKVDPTGGTLPYDEEIENAMLEEVSAAKKSLDSVGGRVTCVIRGLPAGLGDPVFGKFESRLAGAMLGLNAVKGFEYGEGMNAAFKRGSEMTDIFNRNFEPEVCATNHNGGTLGGITSGMPVYFNVCFKPTPTLGIPLPMAREDGGSDIVAARGRHDPCVAMRAPVIVEALAALVTADCLLHFRASVE